MAVAGADAAVARGDLHAVLELAVGLDPKACAEAWTAIQKAQPALAVMLLSPDAGVCAFLASP